ncbi:MAG TPA: hypothetical protein VGM70_01600 [Pseudolysinimonas sp.]|jgi:hypothetical protein
MTRAEKAGRPARRDRLRPVELLLASAGLGVFAGLVVFMGTREWVVAGIFFGVVFIVSLVVVAMLALAFTPPDEKPPVPDDDGPPAH